MLIAAIGVRLFLDGKEPTLGVRRDARNVGPASPCDKEIANVGETDPTEARAIMC